MYKLTSIFAFLFILIFSFNSRVLAADQNLEVEVNPELTSIELSWNNVGTRYEVYFEDNLVYSGIEHNYIKNGLETEYLTKFAIKAFDEANSLVDEVFINTSTLPSYSDLNTQSTLSESDARILSYSNTDNTSLVKAESDKYSKLAMELQVNSISSGNQVTLDWGNIDGVTSYEIYKNDQLIGSSTLSNYIDNNVTPGTEYDYKIIGRIKYSNQAISEISQYYLNNGIQLTQEDQDNVYYYYFDIYKHVTTVGSNLMMAFSSGSTTVKYKIRYTTFIPLKYAKIPFVSYVAYFGGDDRDFDETSNRYRTRSDVNLTFGKKSYLELKKDVHYSHLYSDLFNWKGKKKASSSGIKLSNKTLKSNSISYTLNHDIGIPYGDYVSPDITYSYKATIYKNGSYSIKGSHDQAPSHEMYIRKNKGKYNDIFTHEHKGFRYLWPPAPNRAINYSGDI